MTKTQRQAIADPEDVHTFTRAIAERARIEGDSVYLECLADLAAWDNSSALIQEMAASVVLSRLGGYFEFTYPKTAGMRDWACENRANDLSIPDLGAKILRRFSHRLATFRHEPTGIEFQLLPGFREDHKPGCGFIHFDCKACGGARMSKPFLIARLPVTQKQMVSVGSYRNPDTPCTSLHFDVVISKLDKHGMRLPTAKEWTYACRAGTTTQYYFGDEMNDSHVWHSGNSATRPTGPGGSYQPQPRPHAPKEHDDAGKFNAFGLVDTIGNVSEWVTMPSGYPTTMGDNFTFFPDNMEPTARTDYRDHSAIGFRPSLSIPESRTG